MTLADIATALGVSKSSVSLWVRDVPFTPSKRRYGAQRRPHPAHTAKLRQIEDLNVQGVQRVGTLGEQAFLAAGVAALRRRRLQGRRSRQLREHRPRDGRVLLRMAAELFRD